MARTRAKTKTMQTEDRTSMEDQLNALAARYGTQQENIENQSQVEHVDVPLPNTLPINPTSKCKMFIFS
jgi:hypothetical protein